MNRPAFVDAHVHLWDLDHLRYPWLTQPFAEDGPNGSVEAIARTYGLDDYLDDATAWDVRGIVHVDAGADPAQALDETRWLQDMASKRGMPNAIVAFAALDDPAVEPLLAAHAAHPSMRGIRQIVNWHSDPRRTYTARDITGDAAWARGFAQLAKYGLSFDLQCYPRQMAALATLIAGFPETPVIVNHAGMCVENDPDGYLAWRTGMARLAELSHVSVKLSGFGFVWRAWTEGQVRPRILETIDLFGTDRCLFASDFPTDKLFGSFDRHLTAYDTITASFTPDERRDLFGGNANRIYRLGLDL